MEQDRLKLIEEMLATNPDDSFLKYAAALEYHKIGERKKAIGTIEELLRNDAEYLGAYYKLGKLYEEGGNTDKAIEVYRQGMDQAKNQNDAKAKGELSEALMILGADDHIEW